MGLLWSRLWRRLFSHTQYKLLILGLDNAGKTTILFHLHLGEVINTQPTIGSNVEEVRHKNLHFQVWDLGGQESLRQAWETYYVSTSAVILVVDSSDRVRVNLLYEELKRVLSSVELKDAVLLVFANKQDVKDRMTADEIARELRLQSVRTHQWHIQPCCALTGEGLYEGIDWIAGKVTNKT
jgi:ADP-ribosylation factor-like protein 5B